MMCILPALWETLLAAMKLGAVATPTTMLLTTNDLAERIERGKVRFIVAAAEHAGKFANVAPDCVRIIVGDPTPDTVVNIAGWRKYEHGYSLPKLFSPEGQTLARDPL